MYQELEPTFPTLSVLVGIKRPSVYADFIEYTLKDFDVAHSVRDFGRFLAAFLAAQQLVQLPVCDLWDTTTFYNEYRGNITEHTAEEQT